MKDSRPRLGPNFGYFLREEFEAFFLLPGRSVVRVSESSDEKECSFIRERTFKMSIGFDFVSTNSLVASIFSFNISTPASHQRTGISKSNHHWGSLSRCLGMF